MRHPLITLTAAALLAALASAPAIAAVSLKEKLVDKGLLSSEEAADVRETTLSKFLESIKFSGDLRIRHESFFFQETAPTATPTVDRHRQRVRLRLGTELKLGDFLVIVRLASGGGEAVSTNQSFDNLFTQKGFWIDRAYVVWKGVDGVTIQAGRMANPFFMANTTDLMWDDDVNPEGFAETFEVNPSDSLVLFLNLGQFVLDEDSGDNHDQWLFAQQAGLTLTPADTAVVTLALAYYDFLNTHRNTLGQNPVQQGNSRSAGGVLLNRYKVADVTLVVNLDLGMMPVALMGDYLRNLADTTTGGNGAGSATGNVGYQVGVKIGKASDAHTWEAAYFYKVVETDATVADLSDSDFGNGGIDRRGHIMWLAYNLTQYLQFKAKYFHTMSDTPGFDHIKRLQADLSIKF